MTCTPSVFVSRAIKRSGPTRGTKVPMLAYGGQVSSPKEHVMSKTIAAGLSAFFITASSLAYAQVSTGPAQSSGPTQAAPAQERLTQLGHLRRGFHGGSTDFPGVLADFGVISAEM